MTYAEIEKKYKLTPQFVAFWNRRYGETGTVLDRPRAGRPRKLTRPQEAVVRMNLKRKASSSLRRTALLMSARHHVIISKNTVARTAARVGLVYRLRKPKPLLKPADLLSRLRFARARRPRGFWRRVFWSDETSFALYSFTRGEWVEKDSEPAPGQTIKWPPRIRVWAAISAKGKTPLFRIPKAMKAHEFADLLERKLLPSMLQIFDGDVNGFVFMQDGDGTHTAKSVQNCLAALRVEQLLPWPAHSPDLNPIENAWAIVERYLQRVNPRTERGLWAAMQEAWATIDGAALVRLTTSLPRRLQAVKDAKGGHTQY